MLSELCIAHVELECNYSIEWGCYLKNELFKCNYVSATIAMIRIKGRTYSLSYILVFISLRGQMKRLASSGETVLSYDR